MEGTAEVNETMENSSEALHLKMKENNELHSQTDCVVLQNPTSVISKDTGWTEHFSSTRSTEMLLETLAGKDPHHDLVSPSVSEPSTTSCPSSFSGAIVEELTHRDVNFPNLGSSGYPGSVEASPVRKGLWHNLTGIACGSRKDLVLKDFSRAEDRGKVAASFLSQSLAKRNLQFMQLGSNDLKASHDVVEGDGRQDLSRDIFVHHPLINRNKVIHSSGFQQFLLKSTLNGKSIAYSPQQTDNDTGLISQSQDNMGIDECNNKTSVSMHSSIVKQNKKVLLDGGWFCTGSNVKHNGICLRNWLKQKHHRSYKFERLQMFKQILELVDTSHSQGNALQNLKPSFFVVNSSGIVKYVGSVSTQVPTGNLMYSASHQSFALEPQLKRKRFLKYDTKFQDTLSHEPINSGCGQNLHKNFSSKHQRLGEKNKTVVQHHKYQLSSIEEVYDDDSRTISFDRGYSEQIQLVDSHHSSKLPEHQNLYNTCFQEPVSEISSLEDRWYAGPENLYGNTCTLSSNIYSLGILFFELFCSFESEESQFLAMSNLQHRILPPSLLAECPKEAGFCLWLLHPDPSSRPKSREILSNSLIFECCNVSSIDQSLASIDDTDEETDLLLHFLSSLRNQKENQAAKLAADIQCLEKDVVEVERIHLSRVESLYNSRDVLANSNDNSVTHLHEVIVQNRAMSSWSVSSVNEERMMKNIDQLKHAYFSMRSSVKFSETNVSTRSDVGILKIRDNFNQLQCEAGRKEESTDCLGAFFEGLCKYARYNEFEVHGCIRNVDILNSANVICSLSFDRDEDYFATAGVSKKIKIFEFGALLSDSVDVHYPLIEMSSRSKLSCVCWNNYIKNYLASTDYDGVVQLWDVSIGQGFAQYAEHEKRAWSVDFSPVDPTKLASGSDDCSVKLWSIKERNCVDTIRNVANVCCVQFSPHSSHLLAFGSADYKIYCYDLRNTRTPWCCLPGHGKAVSYVKFVDSETIVSASTDNTLKLWDLNKSSTCGMSTNACSLTFTGHTNEKNFVGLTVFDGYIACGSETNEVFVYHKSLPMPITAHKFGSIDPVSGQETGDENGQFVSSVCWRTKSSMVVAANSSGSLKLLQLV